MFGKDYSETYDTIYKNKDYKKEVDSLCRFLKQYKVQSILDVGCGTGTRDILLNQQEYSVTGIDKSFEMIEIAKKKVKDSSIFFLNIDVLDFDLDIFYDCCLTSFNVLGYIDDLPKFFRIVSKHLKNGGCLILDYWDRYLLRKNDISSRKLNLYFDKQLYLKITTARKQKDAVWIHYDIFRFPMFKFFHEIHLIRTYGLKELENIAKQFGLRLKSKKNLSDIIRQIVFIKV